MSFTGCEEFTGWFTALQGADAEFRTELRRLLRAEDPDLAAVADLVGRHELRLGALLREEFAELPRSTTRTVLQAWCDAVDDGLPFRLLNERPDQPVAFARRRLVRVVTDIDEEGVTVRLSHIPGRHPRTSPSVRKVAAWHDIRAVAS